MGNKVKQFGIEEEDAWAKMTAWCAYQERSHYEARIKLLKLKVDKVQAEEMIARLISEGFLSERRFAMAYAGGKLRMKQWGPRKLQEGLRGHQVSEPCIREALGSISDEEFQGQLARLLQKKLRLTASKSRSDQARAVYTHAMRHGFESQRITRAMKKLRLELDTLPGEI